MTREQKVAEARELRAEGLTYAEAGRRLGVSYTTVWAWLNPERKRAIRRRAEATPRRKAAKRAWENEHDRRPCGRCGQPRGAGAHRAAKSDLCGDCRRADQAAAARARRERIAAMWNDGWLIRAIADALDSTPGSIHVEIAAMRADGWHLPYRYTTGKRAGRKFPEQAAA